MENSTNTLMPNYMTVKDFLPANMLVADIWQEGENGNCVGYQRNISIRRVNELKRNFNIKLMKPITVNRRADGKYYIIDGNHRVQVMRELYGDNVLIPCEVFSGLSCEEECDLFSMQYAGTARVSSFGRFKADRTSKKPYAVQLQGMLDELGLKFAAGQTKHAINCVGSVITLSKRYQLDILREALSIIRDYWDNGQDGVYDKYTVSGMCAFVARYRGMYNRKRLDTVLSEMPLTKFRQATNENGARTDEHIVNYIVGLYNRKLRSGKLPKFTNPYYEE